MQCDQLELRDSTTPLDHQTVTQLERLWLHDGSMNQPLRLSCVKPGTIISITERISLSVCMVYIFTFTYHSVILVVQAESFHVCWVYVCNSFLSLGPSEDLCFPMIFSTFSHYSLFHMAANMYVLWSFSSSAVSLLGREQFMAVYLSAGKSERGGRESLRLCQPQLGL